MAARWVEYGLLLLLATLWGGSYALIAIGVTSIPPATLVAARSVIAGVLLTGILWARGLSLPRDRALWGLCWAQAGLSSVLPFLLIAWGQQSLPSALAVILGSTAPIFAFLLGLMLRGGEGFSWLRLGGIAAGLGGVALVMGPEALASPAGLLPMLALLGSAVCFGTGAYVARGFIGVDPMVPAAASLLCGTIILVPLSLLTEAPWTIAPTREAMLATLAHAVFSTALAVLIYFRLLRTLGVVGTTAQAYLRVPIGAGIGVLLLGETLPPTAWAGFALVAAGVAAMTIPLRRR
jgi:drug/metabolite transporter (DMT)-like permease